MVTFLSSITSISGGDMVVAPFQLELGFIHIKDLQTPRIKGGICGTRVVLLSAPLQLSPNHGF